MVMGVCSGMGVAEGLRSMLASSQGGLFRGFMLQWQVASRQLTDESVVTELWSVTRGLGIRQERRGVDRRTLSPGTVHCESFAVDAREW